MASPAVQESELVAGVRFQKIGKLYHFDTSQHPDIQQGDYVIVDTQRGRQMGQVMGFTEPDSRRSPRQILRPASPRDMLLRQHWAAQQDEALSTCRNAAAGMRRVSDAKFVSAQYNYDGSSVTFFFSAEKKLDTSALRKRLQRKFSAQVEIRQIGPRDVARLIGGFGACGITRCCSTFLTDFSPISIKMAKAQGISLNPSEITGMCGRLRCCLVYEYEQYVEARKSLPRRNKIVGTPFGEAKVLDQLPLRDAVMVVLDDGMRKSVAREDIVPLEEFRRLAEKAKAPCDKHGDGDCDCGKPVGQRQADKLGAQAAPSAADSSPAAPSTPSKKPRRKAASGATAAAKDGDAPPKKRRRRRGGRRNRRRSSAAKKAPQS